MPEPRSQSRIGEYARAAFSASLLGAIAAATVLTIVEAAFLVRVYQPLMFYWVYYAA